MIHELFEFMVLSNRVVDSIYSIYIDISPLLMYNRNWCTPRWHLFLLVLINQ